MNDPRSDGVLEDSVLVTGEALAAEAHRLLLDAGLRVHFTGSSTGPGEIAALASREQVGAIIVRSGTIDEAVLRASKRMRVIANHGAGYDAIDVEAATRRRIPVFVAYGRNARSVAELALAMIVSLHKRLIPFDRSVREGRWRGSIALPTEFSEKTLGIVGFGPTGRQLARLARPFDVTILVHDPFVPADTLPGDTGAVSDLAELMTLCDVISLHVPLNRETKAMVNREMIAKMKRGALLVNTSRGAVVDEAALLDALHDGHLGGAGLDTFAEEPLPGLGHPLSGVANLILSPHVGGVTQEAVRRMSLSAAENVLSILRHRSVNRGDLLNPDVLE